MLELSKLNALTPAQWAASLLDRVAYIKPVATDGGTVFAVHAADGTRIAVIGDRATAYAAVLQHELEPMSVH